MTIRIDRSNSTARTAIRFLGTLAIALCMAGPSQAGLFSNAAAKVKKKATTVATKVQKKVENRENVLKKLVDEVDPTKLIQMLQMTRSAVEFVIAEKAKLDAWQSNGGGEASRSKLMWMIEDIAVAEKSLHQLTCAVAPNRQPFSDSKQQKRVNFMKKVVNAAPKPLLWAADSAFSVALGDSWGGLIGEVNEKVQPIASGIGQLCEAGDRLKNSKVFELNRCEIMREPEFENLEPIENYVGIAGDLITFANHFVKDDIVVTAGATVAAGGAAGTNIKNPTKVLLDDASKKLSKVQKVLGKIKKQRDTCTKRDEKIERDLMKCNALVSYDTGDYAFVADLVQRRYDELYANGLNQVHIPWSHIEGGQFIDICSQYQDLRFGPE